MSDDLRRALTGLSSRERRAMQEQATAAAGKWSALLPRVAAVWEAFGAEVAEVDDLANAREASGMPDQAPRLRPAQPVRL